MRKKASIQVDNRVGDKGAQTRYNVVMKKRSDWVMLSLFFAGKLGLTPVQLQKVVFLLQKSFPSEKNLTYTFRPYNYGPFDQALYNDAGALVDEGLVELHKRNGRTWNAYHSAPKGKEYAELLVTKNKEAADYLKKLIPWVQSLSFQQLIASIYKKYPEYKENSIFRG